MTAFDPMRTPGRMSAPAPTQTSDPMVLPAALGSGIRDIEQRITRELALNVEVPFRNRNRSKQTRPGAYRLRPPRSEPGTRESILSRNYGRGPSIIMLNVRISKVFAFGPAGEGSISTRGRRPQTGPFGGSSGNSVRTGHPNNLAVSLSVRNIVNQNNPGPIIGNITSPLFGLANQPYGTDSLGGTGFSESANNRHWSCRCDLGSEQSSCATASAHEVLIENNKVPISPSVCGDEASDWHALSIAGFANTRPFIKDLPMHGPTTFPAHSFGPRYEK
jgi:hypothetical protein